MRLNKLLITILFLLVCSVGYCGVDLNGDADYINAGDILDGETTFSFCAWVNNDDVTSDAAIAVNTSAVVDNGFLFWRDDVAAISGRTDTYSVRINATVDYILEGATGASIAGDNTFVCFTFDSIADELRLYVNGSEDVNSPVNSGDGAMVDSNHIVSLGYFLDGSTWAFNGKINNTIFCSDVLSSAEILNLYKSKMKRDPLQLNNLLQFLSLDDFSDGTALDTSADGYKDSSGNGNDGTGVDADGDSTNIAEEVLSYPPY